MKLVHQESANCKDFFVALFLGMTRRGLFREGHDLFEIGTEAENLIMGRYNLCRSIHMIRQENSA